MRMMMRRAARAMEIARACGPAAAAQMSWLHARGRREEVGVTCYGAPLRLRSNSRDIGVAMLTLRAEFSILRSVLPPDFDGLIIDAGAFIGTAAISLSRMFPRAQVLAIEPFPENYALVAQNTAPHPNITAIHAALAAKPCARLTLQDRGAHEWGFTILEAPADAPDAPVVAEVEAMTLDQLRQRFGGAEIGIVKLDIEGAEKALFEADDPELRAARAIFVELHDRIAPGCSDAFHRFSRARRVFPSEGEKYLSLRRD